MRALLLGARGAVGRVIDHELSDAGNQVTRVGRTADSDATLDLYGDLSPLAVAAAEHDVVVNASGVERVELAHACGGTPFVEISATGRYLAQLRDTAAEQSRLVLGVGLVPGLSTVLASSLGHSPGDDIDVLVMLGSGERHGPAAADWTAGLVGTDLYQPPEGAPVRNLTSSLRRSGPDGRTRRYLRADFPDHLLLGDPLENGVRVRSWLTLSSALMTGALALVGHVPALRGVLRSSPHVGSDAWHLVVRNRRTGEHREAHGHGQSAATGRLTALAAIRASASCKAAVVTMADLVSLEEALAT